MNEPKGMLYPTLVVSGISVTLFSLLGIAAIAGWLPKANSEDAVMATPSINVPLHAPADTQTTRYGEATDAQRKQMYQPPQSVAKSAVCHSCGTVSTIRATEVMAKPTGVGAVAGGVLGAVVGNQMGGGNGRTVMTVVGAAGGAYAGNEVEKRHNSQMRYTVYVRLDNGGHRTFYLNQPPHFNEGQRVRIEHGYPVSIDNGMNA
jgi:outer membrane lipoprotein SlyB